MRRTLIAALVMALAMMFVPTGGTSFARPASRTTQAAERGNGSDIVRTPTDLKAPIRLRGAKVAHPNAKTPPQVGDVRTWLGLDDVAGGFYTKNFPMRGKGKHIEVWSATGTRTLNGVTTTDLNFQDGDCRNGARTTVTDAQVRYLINQFDRNIYPIESSVFSVPPQRNGGNAPGAAALGLPPTYYIGDGDDIVVLIDNVRDDNLYDLNNTQGFSYIAGFFSSGLNGFFNRNVMTIDAFDWLHRTGQNPPNDPVPGNNCASAPARPCALRGRLRARVPAPAPVVRGPGRGHMDQRGDVGHGDRVDGVRRPGGADRRSALRLAHPVLPRATTRSRPTPTRTPDRVVRRTLSTSGVIRTSTTNRRSCATTGPPTASCCGWPTRTETGS